MGRLGCGDDLAEIDIIDLIYGGVVDLQFDSLIFDLGLALLQLVR